MKENIFLFILFVVMHSFTLLAQNNLLPFESERQFRVDPINSGISENSDKQSVEGVVIKTSTQETSPNTYLSTIKAEMKKQWPENRTINIVFHGHSVPAGYFQTPEVKTLDAYPQLVFHQIKEQYPFAVINVITTSIGGEHAEDGAKRFKKEVLNHRPDVLFIDYALNDRLIGLQRSEKAWRKMIEEALAQHIKVILFTPTPDIIENILDKNTPLSKHSRMIRKLAEEYQIGLVDSYQLFEKLSEQGEDIKTYMSQNNHPNESGHKLVANEILKYFTKSATLSDENLADKPWVTTGGVKNEEWHGFRVYESKIDEFSVWIAEPKTPVKGKPWIMRIQDFGDGFHWQINEKLLNSGAYVVAINSYNVYGADYGLNLMDSLYKIARNHFGLPEKCALAGVSRAGLSVYRWAIQHAECVACIYCEGPVLDFKTWPMSWLPSVNNWTELKQYYGFTSDAEAIAYKGNPIDNLEPIAKAKIPIRHVISLTDEHDTKIVPNDKNTLKAQQYLQQMGHNINIVITPEGMKVPYAFDDKSVEFMISNATP